jgi:hypothetical protein
MNMLRLSSNVRIAYIACYWKFIRLDYLQILCHSRLCKADHIYLTYLMLQRQLSHLNGRKLDHCQVKLLAFSMSATTESESYVTTDGQSASLSWNKAPIWGLRPPFCYCQTVAGLLMWVSLSDERTGLLPMLLAFANIVILRSESRGTREHILLFSDSRLPFSSPPTTRRATVEVFDPASTRGSATT